MVYDIAVVEAASQPVAATRLRTNRRRIGEDIGIGFGLLMQTLGRQHVSVSGPPLIVYHEFLDEQTDGDIEVCVPIAGPILGDDDVIGRELEAAVVATTVHRGPYEAIPAAYGALTAWIGQHGHAIAGPPREIYLNDPRTVAPQDLLTRIEYPIAVRSGSESVAAGFVTRAATLRARVRLSR